MRVCFVLTSGLRCAILASFNARLNVPVSVRFSLSLSECVCMAEYACVCVSLVFLFVACGKRLALLEHTTDALELQLPCSKYPAALGLACSLDCSLSHSLTRSLSLSLTLSIFLSLSLAIFHQLTALLLFVIV